MEEAPRMSTIIVVTDSAVTETKAEHFRVYRQQVVGEIGGDGKGREVRRGAVCYHLLALLVLPEIVCNHDLDRYSDPYARTRTHTREPRPHKLVLYHDYTYTKNKDRTCS